MEGIDSLADKIWVLGGKFGSIEAGNDADESEVALTQKEPSLLYFEKLGYNL